MLGKLEIKEWLSLNAKLQQKKTKLRKALAEKGVMKKGGTNQFDNYTYFSEAQYKELFTELFSAHGLELKFTELAYDTFEGSEKQANGRMPKLMFSLIDTETGFYEETVITGEGIDKGDKAGYKAYTGALKYFLADTFMVATGDDPEKESPDTKMNTRTERLATAAQVAFLAKYYTGEKLTRLLEAQKVEKIEQMSMKKASALIETIKNYEAEKEANRAMAENTGVDPEYLR